MPSMGEPLLPRSHFPTNGSYSGLESSAQTEQQQFGERTQFGSRQPPRTIFAHVPGQLPAGEDVAGDKLPATLSIQRSQSVIAEFTQQQPQGEEIQPFVHKAASNCAYHAVHRKGGYRSAMEDTFSLVPQFMDLHISPEHSGFILTERLQQQWLNKVNSLPEKVQRKDFVSSAPAAVFRGTKVDSLHYFAVFDGHKGTLAAQFCSQQLHENVKRRLQEREVTLQSFSDRSSCDDHNEKAMRVALTVESVTQQQQTPDPREDKFDAKDPVVDELSCKEWEQESRQASIMSMVTASSTAAAALAPQSSSGPHQLLSSDSRTNGRNCNQVISEALTAAFLDTQRDFEEYSSDQQVGTTAVISLVGERQLYVANVGDSRAVLCRKGTALPLSDDQKAEREDEKKRIQDAQGYVFHFGGAMRVFGKVAMTRAIGDTELQPYIMPEPEVTIIDRSPDDEFLILGTDGLWDVIDNQEACSFVECIIKKTRERDPDIARKQQIKCATRMLVDKALKANTKDNVTAVIVDLDPHFKLR